MWFISIGLEFTIKPLQTGHVIRALLTYVAILVATFPALLRARREQIVVELALRQRLATYAASPPTHATMKSAFTPVLSRSNPARAGDALEPGSSRENEQKM
jgi:hypothetical protein